MAFHLYFQKHRNHIPIFKKDLLKILMNFKNFNKIDHFRISHSWKLLIFSLLEECPEISEFIVNNIFMSSKNIPSDYGC
jgi:hypothetical protein